MFKKLWEKIKAWWMNSKIRPIFDKVGKAIRQFLRYAYAAQISYLVLSVIFYLAVSKFAGILLIIWGVILLIAEIRQQKAEKVLQPPV
jgi:asparagine N-glycosylation enzyme membrane subunit Stt3